MMPQSYIGILARELCIESPSIAHIIDEWKVCQTEGDMKYQKEWIITGEIY